MKKIFKMMAAFSVALGMVACAKTETPDPEPEAAPDPKADFEYAIDGLDVTFTNKSENAVSYKWDFGDGETSKEASPKYSYASAGEYTVKLTAANADGVTSKKEATITLAGAPKAYFTATAVDGRPGKYGKILAFDASSSENASSIEWDFGDGEKGTEFKMNHEFPDYGKYTVKATVKNAAGASAEYSAEVEAVALNELFKGTDMEEGDAQYWTLVIADRCAPYADGGEPMGVPAWDATWGYTEDHPSLGTKGCLNFHLTTTRDQSANILMYQAVEVQEGDILHVSCDMKWGANTNDSGLLWFAITDTPGALGETGTVIKEIYNYWNARVGAPVPPYDGNFAGSEGFSEEYGFAGDGETAFAEYECTKTGTIYVNMELRSVWGTCFGYSDGVDNKVNVMFDNFSCKIIL